MCTRVDQLIIGRAGIIKASEAGINYAIKGRTIVACRRNNFAVALRQRVACILTRVDTFLLHIFHFSISLGA